MILVIAGPSSSNRVSKRKVGIESSSHCLFLRRENEITNFWESGWIEWDKFGGGIIGKRKGSGESDGENLERMRSILSLKNWRNELASDWSVGCVRGWIGSDRLSSIRSSCRSSPCPWSTQVGQRFRRHARQTTLAPLPRKGRVQTL